MKRKTTFKSDEISEYFMEDKIKILDIELSKILITKNTLL